MYIDFFDRIASYYYFSLLKSMQQKKIYFYIHCILSLLSPKTLSMLFLGIQSFSQSRMINRSLLNLIFPVFFPDE